MARAGCFRLPPQSVNYSPHLCSSPSRLLGSTRRSMRNGRKDVKLMKNAGSIFATPPMIYLALDRLAKRRHPQLQVEAGS
jgi:hypothetical protein